MMDVLGGGGVANTTAAAEVVSAAVKELRDLAVWIEAEGTASANIRMALGHESRRHAMFAGWLSSTRRKVKLPDAIDRDVKASINLFDPSRQITTANGLVSGLRRSLEVAQGRGATLQGKVAERDKIIQEMTDLQEQSDTRIDELQQELAESVASASHRGSRLESGHDSHRPTAARTRRDGGHHHSSGTRDPSTAGGVGKPGSEARTPLISSTKEDSGSGDSAEEDEVENTRSRARKKRRPEQEVNAMARAMAGMKAGTSKGRK
jgi:hypothetical protein